VQEYNEYLSRIRTFLSGTRTKDTLQQCEKLLSESKKCATAMHGLAEVQGDPMRIREASQRLERDIAPLSREVQRALNDMGREELFYQAPDIEHQGGTSSTDMDALIQSSDDLLRESQQVLAETEQIGTSTLQQMGQQREQLLNANRNIEAVQNVATQAKNILASMSRRACKNKLALYAMIAVLTLTNLHVIKLIYKKHHPTEPDDGSDPGNALHF